MNFLLAFFWLLFSKQQKNKITHARNLRDRLTERQQKNGNDKFEKKIVY